MWGKAWILAKETLSSVLKVKRWHNWFASFFFFWVFLFHFSLSSFFCAFFWSSHKALFAPHMKQYGLITSQGQELYPGDVSLSQFYFTQSFFKSTSFHLLDQIVIIETQEWKLYKVQGDKVISKLVYTSCLQWKPKFKKSILKWLEIFEGFLSY